RRTGQLLAKVLRGDLVDLLQRLAQLGIALRVGSVAVDRLWNRHPDFLSKQPDGFRERDLLVELEKLEDVAAHVAPEAVKESLVRIDVKRRRLFRMKRAQALVRVASLLE